MDDDAQQTEAPLNAADPPHPVLPYRAPRDDQGGKKGEFNSVCGTLAIILGVIMTILAGAAAISEIREMIANGAALSEDDLWSTIGIVLLLLLGAAASAHCARFYFSGGWSRSPNSGKPARKIFMPWTWYSG